MRVIADSLGLLTEDYNITQVVDDADKIYNGFTSVLVDDETIDQFYRGEDIIIDPEILQEQKITLYPHEFVMLVSLANEKKTALARYEDSIHPLLHIYENKEELSFNVNPRNKEQSFAFDLLFDPEIPLVSLIGRAGSGKTLMAIAAGMEQVLGPGQRVYDRLIISRPVQPMGKDIGFLPGTMEEKMLPWLKPIEDNIRYAIGDNNVKLKEYMDIGKLEVEAFTYIRGRSISNSFVIIDEAQNYKNW